MEITQKIFGTYNEREISEAREFIADFVKIKNDDELLLYVLDSFSQKIEEGIDVVKEDPYSYIEKDR